MAGGAEDSEQWAIRRGAAPMPSRASHRNTSFRFIADFGVHFRAGIMQFVFSLCHDNRSEWPLSRASRTHDVHKSSVAKARKLLQNYFRVASTAHVRFGSFPLWLPLFVGGNGVRLPFCLVSMMAGRESGRTRGAPGTVAGDAGLRSRAFAARHT